MSDVGGNTAAMIQVKDGTEKNAIGERVPKWKDAQRLTGFLDLMGGGTGYTAYNAKIQESTHIFICDYKKLAAGVTAETARMLIDGKAYDVTLIDNPMGLDEHLEIYLKYTGGQ